MVPTWIILGLIFSAFSVSSLGAAFSIFGLRDLFSGAAIAVVLMAASLEFAKFTLAAYLYERWKVLNRILKTYLVSAVTILSMITSMGIYGFLSNAYQSASSVLEGEQIKLSALQGQLDRNKNEINRLNHMIDEIPASRVTKRLEMRKEVEPQIADLNKVVAQVSNQIDESNLKVLEVKQKVGPLIYISKAFNVDIDNVVKYLVLVIVLVFDPLAISLVIASSESLSARRKEKANRAVQASQQQTFVPQQQTPPQTVAAQQPIVAQQPIIAQQQVLAQPLVLEEQPNLPEQPIEASAPQTEVTIHPPEHIVKMRFSDEAEQVDKDEKAI